MNINTHLVPASDTNQFSSSSAHYNNSANNGAIQKLQEMNVYLMSVLETARSEREKDAAKLKKIEQEMNLLTSKNGELAREWIFILIRNRKK